MMRSLWLEVVFGSDIHIFTENSRYYFILPARMYLFFILPMYLKIILVSLCHRVATSGEVLCWKPWYRVWFYYYMFNFILLFCYLLPQK